MSKKKYFKIFMNAKRRQYITENGMSSYFLNFQYVKCMYPNTF